MYYGMAPSPDFEKVSQCDLQDLLYVVSALKQSRTIHVIPSVTKQPVKPGSTRSSLAHSVRPETVYSCWRLDSYFSGMAPDVRVPLLSPLNAQPVVRRFAGHTRVTDKGWLSQPLGASWGSTFHVSDKPWKAACWEFAKGLTNLTWVTLLTVPIVITIPTLFPNAASFAGKQQATFAMPELRVFSEISTLPQLQAPGKEPTGLPPPGRKRSHVCHKGRR